MRIDISIRQGKHTMGGTDFFKFFGVMGVLMFVMPIVIIAVVFRFAVLPAIKMASQRKRLIASGKPELATVVEVSQTGLTVNQMPQMRVVLDIQEAGAAARRVETKQLVDLGSMPRAGDLVYVMVDPQNPDSVMLAGAPPPQPRQQPYAAQPPVGPPNTVYAPSAPVAPITPDASFAPAEGYVQATPSAPNDPLVSSAPFVPNAPASPITPAFGGGAFGGTTAFAPTAPAMPVAPTADQITLDTISITPRLRENGTLAVATVLATTPTSTQATSFDLEIDAINAPKRNMTVSQIMYGESYVPGDRVYLLVDPADPNSIAILPLSLTGGNKLPHGANRLDALVLGPQILREGAKAQGTIESATQIPMNNPILEAQGMSRWHLRVRIVPENGMPSFEAEQDLAFTTQEKAQRIAHAGAMVPIRYDSNDPQSFVTDSIAMGYNDPYAAVFAAWRRAIGHA